MAKYQRDKYKYKCEHPGCRKSFRTLKLKLNRHDFSDYECKKDTITFPVGHPENISDEEIPASN